jgi:pyridinium-3,5-biscarboxylic acid mononucleotide sulfurtransferase
MMADGVTPLDRLRAALSAGREPAVAVSGGVDSMTLAVIAARWLAGQPVVAVHAVSPAVPAAATARVHAYAEREGWNLKVIDAGEFADAEYRRNPANRCFFCKTNLYGAMAAVHGGTLLSGTNTDDLGDWRPGLKAATDHGVRHPYVEAGFDKAGVRSLARDLGLNDLAELPSAPCLSSRVETGIAIDPMALSVIDRVETLIRDAMAPETVRCRQRHSGFIIEMDEASLARLRNMPTAGLRAEIETLCGGPVGFAPYRMGSAFLRSAVA